MNKYITYAIIYSSIVLSGCACLSSRTYTVVSADDVGDAISTKYRYNLKDSAALISGLMYEDVKQIASIKDMAASRRHMEERQVAAIEYMISKYPNVFSDSGIPVKIGYASTDESVKYTWSCALTILSGTLFPATYGHYSKKTFDIAVANDAAARDSLTIESAEESAEGLFPTAFIPFGGKPNYGTKRIYWRSEKAFESDSDRGKEWETKLRLKTKLKSDLCLEGFAYGVAAKLKEMEDSGMVDSALQKMEAEKLRLLEAEKLKAPAHRVVSIAQDTGRDFTFRFKLELLEMPHDPDKAKSAVLKEFRESLKNEYAASVPGAKKTSFVANLTEVKMDGRLIHGRATLLAMSLVSLSYDASTRRGKLSVRFNAGQDKEAREWIRKNIETLARDKNIAPVTGQLPPDANCDLLGEKVDGNVMEIEFKTE